MTLPITSPLQEKVKKRIYRLIIDVDIRICMHIGRPLEVQSEENPASVTASDANPWLRDFETSHSTFRQLAFTVLSLLPKITASCDAASARKYISSLSVQLEDLDAQCFSMLVSETPAESVVLSAEHQIERLALLMLLSCSLGELRKRMGTISDPAGTTQKRMPKLGLTTADYTQSAVKAAGKIIDLFTDIQDPEDGWTWTSAYACFCATAIISIAIVNGHTKVINIDHIEQAIEYFRRAARQQRHEFHGLDYAQLDRLWAQVKVVMGQNGSATRTSTTIKESLRTTLETTELQPSLGRGRKRRNDINEGDEIQPSSEHLRTGSRLARPTSSKVASDGQQGTLSPCTYSDGQLSTNYSWDTSYDYSGQTVASTPLISVTPNGAQYNMINHLGNYQPQHNPDVQAGLLPNPSLTNSFLPSLALEFWDTVTPTSGHLTEPLDIDNYPLVYWNGSLSTYSTEYTGPVTPHV